MSFELPPLDDLTSLDQALSFDPHVNGDAGLTAAIAEDFSNGPVSLPPETGFPFGGLMAALAVKAMQQRLGLTAPLRTLSVQFLAAAKYGQAIQFQPRLLRRGRTVAYAAVEASQGDRPIVNASGTFGQDIEWSDPMSDLNRLPPPLSSMREGPGLVGPMAPRFSQYVDYRFETGPNILGGNIGKEPTERLWMRMRDGAPVDALRLCYLLDALYPPAMTLTPDYLRMTSVDLRYDILRDLTPDLAPEGWVFVQYRILEHNFGWSMDDAIVWAPDGRPVALARQRRKVL